MQGLYLSKEARPFEKFAQGPGKLNLPERSGTRGIAFVGCLLRLGLTNRLTALDDLTNPRRQDPHSVDREVPLALWHRPSRCGLKSGLTKSSFATKRPSSTSSQPRTTSTAMHSASDSIQLNPSFLEPTRLGHAQWALWLVGVRQVAWESHPIPIKLVVRFLSQASNLLLGRHYLVSMD